MAMTARPIGPHRSRKIGADFFGGLSEVRSFRLPLKALSACASFGEFVGKKLSGPHMAAQLAVLPPQYHAHAPTADLAKDAVKWETVDPRVGSRGPGVRHVRGGLREGQSLLPVHHFWIL